MISLSGYFSNHHLVPGKGEGYRAELFAKYWTFGVWDTLEMCA